MVGRKWNEVEWCLSPVLWGESEKGKTLERKREWKRKVKRMVMNGVEGKGRTVEGKRE